MNAPAPFQTAAQAVLSAYPQVEQMRAALIAARDVLEDLRPLPFQAPDPELDAVIAKIDAALAHQSQPENRQ